MNQQQFEFVTAWQGRTFPDANALSKIAHLAEELQELVDDLKNDAAERRLEFADCFLLLFGAAAADGMNYQDICNAINEKMNINITRKWGHPDENGVVRHIEKENDDDEAEFITCGRCDGHPACENFGCAYDLGLGKMVKNDFI